MGETTFAEHLWIAHCNARSAKEYQDSAKAELMHLWLKNAAKHSAEALRIWEERNRERKDDA